MIIGNVKVPEKRSMNVNVDRRKKTSLKSIKSIRSQIKEHEKTKKVIEKAAKEGGNDARKSIQVQLEIKKAFERLRGNKVHDDLSMLKKAEKNVLRKKKKSASNWAARVEEVKAKKAERQVKRQENIDKYRKGGKATNQSDSKSGGKIAEPGAKKETRKQRKAKKEIEKKRFEKREEVRAAKKKSAAASGKPKTSARPQGKRGSKRN